ncbi:hypothetical protein [Haloechinothrix sp. LS1_15]|uniref:hypothetical protein n=1 Tax=Haloechinothrix sp. LS1_15 TaxID=2652248 RepID=UPI002947CBEA|nr:hypothetical protein [Haloechinothrix sp. LS1_15]MDV6014711.1 hypothetical protein [Haloechinothrix sp. LS1_15]
MRPEPRSGHWAALAIGAVIAAAGVAAAAVFAPGGGTIAGTPQVPGSDGRSADHLAALTMEPNPQAVEAPDGSAHIPACRVVTPGDVHGMGHRLHDYAGTLNEGELGIERTVFDYVGEADVESDRSLTTAGSVTATCEYTFDLDASDDVRGVDVVVVQPFLANEDTIERDLDNYYEPAGSFEGVDLYERASDEVDFLTHALVTDEAVVLLRTFNLAEDDRTSVTEAAATNLIELLAEPEGPATPRYEASPVGDEFVRACPLLDNTGIREVTGNDAEPIATETIPVISATTATRPEQRGHEYIYNGCRRKDTIPSTGDVIEDMERIFDPVDFSLSTRTFERAEGAEAYFDSVTTGSSSPYQEGTILNGLGDQAFAGKGASGFGVVDLVVRRGPVVFDLSYDVGTERDVDETIDVLGPFAERILDQLASDGY